MRRAAIQAESMPCAACGHANRAHAKFCEECGASLSPPAATPEPRAYTPRHLIERILFLDATPAMEYMELKVGSNVKQQLEADLQLETNAVAMYNKAVQIARDNGDDQSRELFSKLLKDEEEHVDWLEAQLHQIKEMGYERYLSNQTAGPKD